MEMETFILVLVRVLNFAELGVGASSGEGWGTGEWGRVAPLIHKIVATSHFRVKVSARKHHYVAGKPRCYQRRQVGYLT